MDKRALTGLTNTAKNFFFLLFWNLTQLNRKVNSLSQFLLVTGLAIALISIAEAAANASVSIRKACAASYRVIRQYPHDAAHFTQGLSFKNGRLFESTGGYGQSGVFEKELTTGRSVLQRALPPSMFGEGLATLGDRLFQLSWRSGVGLIYDLRLRALGRFSYRGQGWGLTRLQGDLVMSNGSADLTVLDGRTLRAKRRIHVRRDGRPQPNLNELEFAQGQIFANVWQRDEIVGIDPTDGQVRKVVNLKHLRQRFRKPRDWNAVDNVLNGIAFNADSGNFYVTGKRWPALFEIQIAQCSPGRAAQSGGALSPSRFAHQGPGDAHR